MTLCVYGSRCVVHEARCASWSSAREPSHRTPSRTHSPRHARDGDGCEDVQICENEQVFSASGAHTTHALLIFMRAEDADGDAGIEERARHADAPAPDRDAHPAKDAACGLGHGPGCGAHRVAGDREGFAPQSVHDTFQKPRLAALTSTRPKELGRCPYMGYEAPWTALVGLD